MGVDGEDARLRLDAEHVEQHGLCWKEQASETRSPKRSRIAVTSSCAEKLLGPGRERGDVRVHVVSSMGARYHDS